MNINIELTDIDREQLEDGKAVTWYFGDHPDTNRITVQFTKRGR